MSEINLEKLCEPFPRTAIKSRTGGGGDIKGLYEEGCSINEIAAMTNSNYGTTRRRLLEAGVTLRTNVEGTRLASPRSSIVRWGTTKPTTRRCCICQRDLPLEEFGMRSTGKFRRSECWHCRRSGNGMRRVKDGAAVDAVDFRRIIERDGWTCHICKQPIEPGSHHFDHVAPLSLGGSHTEDNIRLAHAVCNRRKGNRVEQMA